jgi:membrane-associated phospholipid phosphatase
MHNLSQLKSAPILWKRGALWLAFLGPFFFITYGWLNVMTSHRADVHVMVESWEHLIPFVPWLMLPYMSIDAFYAASLFMFKKRAGLDKHALRLLLATIISLFGFWLYPLQFSFAVPKAEGFNGLLQTLLLGFDKPYNQAPSLHISLLIILWVVYANSLAGFAKWALHVWFVAIAASVLLVYQHHFVDVWTGALVGVVCLYLIPTQPFKWRFSKPTARQVTLGTRYFIGAIVAVLIAQKGHLSFWPNVALVWVSVALGLVAIAYFGLGATVFQRYKGNIAWPAKWLLAPYLLGSWVSYRLHTKRKPLPTHIHHNVWLGPFPRPLVKQMGVQWKGVLDLTTEFSASHLTPVLSKYVPVLDLTPPTPTVLVKAVRWLDYAQEHGNVLVHCALGLSRSASVVVCWLLWRGYANNVQQAVAIINQKNKAVLLSPAHEQAILNALQLLKNRQTNQKP